MKRYTLSVSIVVVLVVLLQGVTAAQAAGRGGRERPAPERRPRLPGFIVGVVTDAATGDPIKGAVVNAMPANQPLPMGSGVAEPSRASHPIEWGYRTTTNGRGRYNMTVPPGEYWVTVSARGYVDRSTKDLLTVRSKRTTRFDAELEKQGFGTVTGTVFGVAPDGVTKTPLEGAEVSLYPQGGVIIMDTATGSMPPASNGDGKVRPDIYPPPFPHTRTDANGKFKFENVPTGEASVSAWRIGYGYDSEQIKVLKDQTTDVTLDLPLQSATVKGTVTDADTGDPVAGVLVMVRVIFDNVPPEILLGEGAPPTRSDDDFLPPEAELVGVTDEKGEYQLLLPLYDIIAYAENVRAGISADARPMPPPFLQKHVLVAFKRGYEVAAKTIENPQIGATIVVDFQLKKKAQ